MSVSMKLFSKPTLSHKIYEILSADLKESTILAKCSSSSEFCEDFDKRKCLSWISTLSLSLSLSLSHQTFSD
jgi:hypothetical protein